METEKRIDRAKAVMRGLLGRYGKPHHRNHGGAALDNVNRLRALEGLCGHCANLELEFRRRDGKEVVVLDCEKEHSPVALYDIQVGEKVSCEDFKRSVRK